MNFTYSNTPLSLSSGSRLQSIYANPFKALVQSLSNHAIFLTDQTGIILTWNPGAEIITGYTSEEIIGQHLSIFYPLKDQPNHPFYLELQLALDQGQLEIITQRVRKSGVRFTIQYTLIAIYEHENHVGFSVTMSRLHDSHQLETKLHTWERRHNTFFNTPTVGMMETSVDGRILRVNDAFCRMVGYSREELLRMTGLSLFFLEDQEQILFEDSQIGKGTKGSYPCERRYRRKDGSALWGYVHVCEVRDEFECPLETSIVVIDLTARKHTELELKRQRTELQLILDTVPALIYFKNRDHRIVRANAEMSRVLGLPLKQIEGKTDEELGLPDAARYQKDEDEIMKSGKPKRGIIEIVRTAQGARWLQTEKLPLFDPQGQIVGIIGLAMDITDRRKLEDQFHQAQKMEAVGRLAGGIAHDFNNLLTIISGFSDLVLVELENDHPSRISVNAIRDASQKASALTQQLLDFSRKQIVEPMVLDLNEVVSNSEKLLRRLIGERIVLTSVLTPVLRLIEADPHQIEQVIMNLVLNARDAMSYGGQITIETKNTEISEDQAYGYANMKPGRYVQLSVSDTGHGMTEEVKSQIFEPFFTTKEVGKGTGLGLSVVHGIVKQTGGYIGVHSEIDIGTTFKILFPAMSSSVKKSSTAILQLPRSGTETILLVEDEEEVRQISRIALETQGYRVLEVNTGVKAVELASQKTEKIDLVLTDVVMPEMGGKELVELIRIYHPDLKVLFIGGYTDDAIVRRQLIEGTFTFLPKPFSPSGLVKKVSSLLDQTDDQANEVRDDDQVELFPRG